MKQLLLLAFTGIVLISCKTNQKGDSVDGGNLEEIISDEILTGKVIDNKRKKVGYAAIRLIIDESNCMSAYTDKDGLYAFTINPTKIKEDSYFEVVFKGFAKKVIPYKDVVANSTIRLTTKGTVITGTDYKIFYEEARKCTR